MVKRLKQLVLECFHIVTSSPEFRETVLDMIKRAVFGTLELINQASQFLYNKVVEIGKLIASKINSFIKYMSR